MDLAPQFASKSIYRFKRKIGSGGCAEVFLYSRQTEGFPAQEVVLKILKSAGEETVRELLNEGTRLSSLRHPNILATFGYEKIDDEKFGLILEYFPGENLKALIPRFYSEDRPTIAGYVIRVLCEALAAAHSQDVIHGDFSGRNVLISEMGQIKLSDFGLATRASKLFQSDGPLKGSADYLAPERWAGQGVSKGADVFALGILAYEILTGTPPLDFGVQSFLTERPWQKFPLWKTFFDGVFAESALRLSAHELLQKIPEDGQSVIDIQRTISTRVRPEATLEPMKTQTHLLGVSNSVISRGCFYALTIIILLASLMTSGETEQDRGKPAYFRPCVLTLTSRPWGELIVDGISRGYTPLINLSISPGLHTLVWRDSLGRELTKSLRAYENSTLAFKIFLDHGHPQVQPITNYYAPHFKRHPAHSPP